MSVIQILDFLKNYWVLITFFIGILSTMFMLILTIFNGIKCSLRNDILEIYDRCKDKKQITHYQLQSIDYSYALYKKLRGNSFVDEIKERIKSFELVD